MKDGLELNGEVESSARRDRDSLHGSTEARTVDFEDVRAGRDLDPESAVFVRVHVATESHDPDFSADRGIT
jgi:hypothetical protein